MVSEAPATSAASSATSSDEVATEPTNKRARMMTSDTANDFFGEMFAVDATSLASHNQVDEYLDSPTATVDILLFWQQKAEVWPQLSYVARHLLSVPAASTSPERSFSIAGRTVEDRRCQLKSDTVDGLFVSTRTLS